MKTKDLIKLSGDDIYLSVDAQTEKKGYREGGYETVNSQYQLRSLFQAAERLGCSYWTIYRGTDVGMIKGVRLGARLLISEAEIQHLAEHGFGPQVRRRRGPKAS